jgi:hypothetical protein
VGRLPQRKVRVIVEREAHTRSSGHDRSLARRGWLRTGLLLLAATPLVVGAWALLSPRSFYGDFPSEGRYWVSVLGPYDEHLVRDVGALNLALCALLVFAAIVLEKRLVQAALVAWLVYAIPHFAFQLTPLHAFSLGDYLANVISLGLLVVLPLILLVLAVSYPRGTEDERPSG